MRLVFAGEFAGFLGPLVGSLFVPRSRLEMVVRSPRSHIAEERRDGLGSGFGARAPPLFVSRCCQGS